MRQAASPRRLTARIEPEVVLLGAEHLDAARKFCHGAVEVTSEQAGCSLGQADVPQPDARASAARSSLAPRRPSCRHRRRPGIRRRVPGRSRCARAARGHRTSWANAVASSAKRSAASSVVLHRAEDDGPAERRRAQLGSTSPGSLEGPREELPSSRDPHGAEPERREHRADLQRHRRIGAERPADGVSHRDVLVVDAGDRRPFVLAPNSTDRARSRTHSARGRGGRVVVTALR